LGTRRTGLKALSVPVFDWSGRIIVAVTALGMAPRLNADIRSGLARKMLTWSDELSAPTRLVQCAANSA
jgi:DNA-binding IclR family transcriptional regulator